jgi:F0F1-type ATP synthase assembly protein I
MADTDDRADNQNEEQPPIIVPSHDPLPPPPDIQFTRPRLGRPESGPRYRELAAKGHASDTGPKNADGAGTQGSGLAAGLTFGSSALGGALVGHWIDLRWNHTSMPWGTIGLLAVGGAAGFISMMRILSRSSSGRK